MIPKDAWPIFFALYLAFVAIPCGVATGVVVGLVLTWRQRSERWLLIPDAAIGSIGFLLGDFASAFGPTRVRIHHLSGGATLTNYNEPFLQPVRYGIQDPKQVAS